MHASIKAATRFAALRPERVRDKLWRKRKHGYTWRVLTLIRNGIAVARVQTSSMASNTCCTALLVQGTIASPT